MPAEEIAPGEANSDCAQDACSVSLARSRHASVPFVAAWASSAAMRSSIAWALFDHAEIDREPAALPTNATSAINANMRRMPRRP